METQAPLRRFAASWLVLGLLACLAAPACQSVPNQTPSEPYLLVLGTAQDGGLPQLGCRRECCERARKDRHLRRMVTSLLLVDPASGQRWLFDASPDLPEQVELARGHGENELPPGKPGSGRPPLFSGIFLTHAHLGHYTGLLHLGREAYGTQTTPLYATERLLKFLQSEGPWSLLFDGQHMQGIEIVPDEPIQLTPELSVTAWKVPHRDEFSDTVGFWIQGPSQSALYLPDIDKWQAWERDLAEVLAQVDFALIDGTFFGPDELPGRDMSEVPHPFIVETLRELVEVPETLRRRVFFTHLNHSNPAADPRSLAAEQVRILGASVLRDGQILEL